MPAPKRANTVAATEAAAKAARQRRLTRMAEELAAAGIEVTLPPGCPHDGVWLDWCDDQYVCPRCGDEWDYKTIHGRELP
jgi:hypothetical protein